MPNKLSREYITSIRSALMSVLDECPFGGNPVDCQCHEIRRRSVTEQQQFLKSLDDERIVDLYTHHMLCLRTKMKNDLAGMRNRTCKNVGTN